ncbi:hypothetical protein NQ318_014231 [Aromia moschata]|uniref:Uncharacterized protein n=1 Tax=Aromia moschata TaxID=1265417 RepID=A0AAV8Z0U7_9CUCU|nr:hypothetical protein NQ318_014231 [Aromia moschata]
MLLLSYIRFVLNDNDIEDRTIVTSREIFGIRNVSSPRVKQKSTIKKVNIDSFLEPSIDIELNVGTAKSDITKQSKEMVSDILAPTV